MTKFFSEFTKGTGSYSSLYDWDGFFNWTPTGLPTAGADLAYTAVGTGNDQQVDDIPNLAINSLSFAATATASESLFFGGNLTIGTLTLTSGANLTTLEATSFIGTDPDPTVVINGLAAGSSGLLLALGPGATINDYASTDPGDMTFGSGSGGVMLLENASAASSTLAFENASAIFELINPGAVVSAKLTGVQVGDTIELQGDTVSSVTYGATTMTIDTDSIAVTFDDVAYSGGALTAATGFYGAFDPASGGERIVFGAATMNAVTQATGPYAEDYDWSNTANWSGGIAPTSGDVTLGSSFNTDPDDTSSTVTERSVVLDETNFALSELSDQSSGNILLANVLINGSGTIGSVVLPIVAAFIADATISGSPTSAVVTITNSLSIDGGTGHVGASGAGAVMNIDIADPQGQFRASNFGVIAFLAPLDDSFDEPVELNASGIAEFFAPAATISGLLSLDAPCAIELPGSEFVAASETINSLTVATDAGTFSFTDIERDGGTWGVIASHDASTGLEKLTFQADANVESVAASGTGIVDGAGDLGVGAKVTLTVNMSSAVTVDTSAGSPTLMLDNGAIATFASGSGTDALAFTYVVAAGQNSSDLNVTAFNPHGAAIIDLGNGAADMSGAVTNPVGTLRIDGTAPTVSLTAAAYVSATKVALSGKAGDNVGVAGVEIFNGTTDLGAAAFNAASGAWSFSGAVAPSAYVALKAVAKDAAGNASSAAILAVGNIQSPSNVSDAVGFSKLIESTSGYQAVIVDTLADIQANKPALNSLIAAGHVASLTATGVSGQSYDFYELDYDASGELTLKKFFFAATGQAYSSYEYDYSVGNAFIGSRFFYTGVKGQAYTGYEYDYDGGGNVVRAAFSGVTGAPYSAYEYDYVGGLFAGSKFTFTIVPAGATYSSYQTDYDQANKFTGDKFFFTDVAGQSYTGEEEDFDTNGKLSRVIVTGVVGQAYSSLEEDYSAGVYTAYKAEYTGISGQNFTSEEVDVSAAGQLQKVVYAGISGASYSSVEQDYSGGVVADTRYGFTNVTGANYYAFQVEEDASGALIEATYDLNGGGHAIVGARNALTIVSIGDDKITGGGANETFVFNPIFGADKITDFAANDSGANRDMISFSTVDFANFAAVVADAKASGTGGGDTTITSATTGDALTLNGVTTTQLAGLSADFAFHG